MACPTSQVLVAYATTHGSAMEVAEAIGAKLRAAGHEVEVLPADVVHEIDAHEAVVLGGTLHTSRWHGDARKFLERHRAALARVPFAAFAVGNHDGARSRAHLDKALAKFPELTPAAVAIFDHRAASGDAVDAWAEQVARSFADGAKPASA
jgi:menaquinone-dependent protoporphyrinogen IX oxidase